MDAKETQKKDTYEIPVGKLRRNPWIISTIVLAIVLLVVLIFNGEGISIRGQGAEIIDADTAGQNVLGFINSNPDLEGQVSLVSSERQGEIYQVVLNFQGQQVPVYTTLDGKFLISNVIPLDPTASADNLQGAPNLEQLPYDVEVEAGDSPSIGSENAKITIVEFSDFSCPFCGAAAGKNQEVIDYLRQGDPTWSAPIPGIMEKYVKAGKVRLVYKYFPGHGTGQAAQIVGLCLNEQKSDYFWEFHDLAFANQELTNDYASMKNLAKQVGADSNALDECINSKKYEASLQEDTNYGSSLGVTGTPTFFVNGIRLEGAQSFAEMSAVIDQELSK